MASYFFDHFKITSSYQSIYLNILQSKYIFFLILNIFNLYYIIISSMNKIN